MAAGKSCVPGNGSQWHECHLLAADDGRYPRWHRRLPGNTAFGVPTDGDASDDFIITRDQYTISYSQNRNTPNWVSYEFDATHFGTNVDRCDCFTHDPALPASFTH